MRERVRFDIGCNLIALSSSNSSGRQIAERASGRTLSLFLFLSLVRTQFKAREGNRNSCSPFMESVTVHSFVVSVVSLSCLSLSLSIIVLFVQIAFLCVTRHAVVVDVDVVFFSLLLLYYYCLPCTNNNNKIKAIR